jgi:hypothetical protein
MSDNSSTRQPATCCDRRLGRKLLVEEAEQQTHANMRQRRIVARTFVAQKRVGGVELMPFKFGFRFIEPLGNFEPALERDMGILSSPNEQDRRLSFPKPLQCVVFSARTKRAGVLSVG